MLQILSPNHVFRCLCSAHTVFVEYMVYSTGKTEDWQVDIAEALDKQPWLGEKGRERRSAVVAANRAESVKNPSCQTE